MKESAAIEILCNTVDILYLIFFFVLYTLILDIVFALNIPYQQIDNHTYMYISDTYFIML